MPSTGRKNTPKPKSRQDTKGGNASSRQATQVNVQGPSATTPRKLSKIPGISTGSSRGTIVVKKRKEVTNDFEKDINNRSKVRSDAVVTDSGVKRTTLKQDKTMVMSRPTSNGDTRTIQSGHQFETLNNAETRAGRKQKISVTVDIPIKRGEHGQSGYTIDKTETASNAKVAKKDGDPEERKRTSERRHQNEFDLNNRRLSESKDFGQNGGKHIKEEIKQDKIQNEYSSNIYKNNSSISIKQKTDGDKVQQRSPKPTTVLLQNVESSRQVPNNGNNTNVYKDIERVTPMSPTQSRPTSNQTYEQGRNKTLTNLEHQHRQNKSEAKKRDVEPERTHSNIKEGDNSSDNKHVKEDSVSQQGTKVKRVDEHQNSRSKNITHQIDDENRLTSGHRANRKQNTSDIEVKERSLQNDHQGRQPSPRKEGTEPLLHKTVDVTREKSRSKSDVQNSAARQIATSMQSDPINNKTSLAKDVKKHSTSPKDRDVSRSTPRQNSKLKSDYHQFTEESRVTPSLTLEKKRSIHVELEDRNVSNPYLMKNENGEPVLSKDVKGAQGKTYPEPEVGTPSLPGKEEGEPVSIKSPGLARTNSRPEPEMKGSNSQSNPVEKQKSLPKMNTGKDSSPRLIVDSDMKNKVEDKGERANEDLKNQSSRQNTEIMNPNINQANNVEPSTGKTQDKTRHVKSYPPFSPQTTSIKHSVTRQVTPSGHNAEENLVSIVSPSKTSFSRHHTKVSIEQMTKHDMHDVEEPSNQARSTPGPISTGQQIPVASSLASTDLDLDMDEDVIHSVMRMRVIGENYCQYCAMSFKNKIQLDFHRAKFCIANITNQDIRSIDEAREFFTIANSGVIHSTPRGWSVAGKAPLRLSRDHSIDEPQTVSQDGEPM